MRISKTLTQQDMITMTATPLTPMITITTDRTAMTIPQQIYIHLQPMRHCIEHYAIDGDGLRAFHLGITNEVDGVRRVILRHGIAMGGYKDD
jgi:hypothetical protein